MKTTRRKFIQTSGTAVASALVLNQFPIKLSATGLKSNELSFGFQVWTIRKKLINDIAATLKEMKELGFSEIEMCSPVGYSMLGFKPLNDLKGTEMNKIIEEAGLKCTSSHFTLGELRNKLDDRIEWAHDLGMKQMILSTFWLPRDASIEDYRKSADELNRIAEKTKAAGIQMGFHNHHFEFETRSDELIYDALMDADYFRKYPGRFISAHLTDWSSETGEEAVLGQGVVEWDELFEASKIGGVENFFVEMDPDKFKQSAGFLKQT